MPTNPAAAKLNFFVSFWTLIASALTLSGVWVLPWWAILGPLLVVYGVALVAIFFAGFGQLGKK